MPRKKKQTVIERMPLKYVTVIVVVIFALAGVMNNCLPDVPDRQALPTATLNTVPSFCFNSGFSPAGWVQEGGIVKRNLVCYSGSDGGYIGACPCADNYVAVVGFGTTIFSTTTAMPSATPPQTTTQTATRTPTASATATKTQTYTPTATKTPTATITKTPVPETLTPQIPTNTRTATLTYTPVPPTFTATSTVTPTPSNQLCLKSVWTKQLKIRPSPSMYNITYGLSIDPGAIIPITEVIENSEGTFGKMNWLAYAAMHLNSNGRTYAVLVDCP